MCKTVFLRYRVTKTVARGGLLYLQVYISRRSEHLDRKCHARTICCEEVPSAPSIEKMHGFPGEKHLRGKRLYNPQPQFDVRGTGTYRQMLLLHRPSRWNRHGNGRVSWALSSGSPAFSGMQLSPRDEREQGVRSVHLMGERKVQRRHERDVGNWAPPGPWWRHTTDPFPMHGRERVRSDCREDGNSVGQGEGRYVLLPSHRRICQYGVCQDPSSPEMYSLPVHRDDPRLVDL